MQAMSLSDLLGGTVQEEEIKYPDPEAQLMELRALRDRVLRMGEGCFEVGAIITPIASCNIIGAGDVLLACYTRQGTVAKVWFESCWFEVWTAPAPSWRTRYKAMSASELEQELSRLHLKQPSEDDAERVRMARAELNLRRGAH